MNEFVESFNSDSPSTTSKSFVRGETVINSSVVNNFRREEYKPQAKYSHTSTSREQFTHSTKDSKKKRSIDELKEEFQREQDMRERMSSKHYRYDSRDRDLEDDRFERDFIDESHDRYSTNLYLANLAPQVTEAFLWKEFGLFGPISSIQITSPDKDDRRKRRSSGFLSFVERANAEEARDKMNGRDFFGFRVKIGWGRPQTKSSYEEERKNSHHRDSRREEHSRKYSSRDTYQSPETKQSPSEIRVIIPHDSERLNLINKLASFVARDGSDFERKVRDKERDNPKFQFLFDENSLESNYYHWRVYSFQQGDDEEKWKTQSFQMYPNGPIWIPPPLPKIEHFRSTSSKEEPGSGSLTDSLKNEFEDILKNLTTERKSIKEAMGFAMDHTEKSGEIVKLITESICLKEDLFPIKLARLYLVNDILYNSGCTKVMHASSYRRRFESQLPLIFEHLREFHKGIQGRISAENVKEQILRLLRIWEVWSIYPTPFFQGLQTTFLGKDTLSTPNPPTSGTDIDEDIDGVPLFEEPAIPNDMDLHNLPLHDLERLCQQNGIPVLRRDASEMIQKLSSLPLFSKN